MPTQEEISAAALAIFRLDWVPSLSSTSEEDFSRLRVKKRDRYTKLAKAALDGADQARFEQRTREMRSTGRQP